MYTAYLEQDFLGQEINGPPYEEIDGKLYVDRNGSLRTITWKGDGGDDQLKGMLNEEYAPCSIFR